jgi:arylsulfatase A-like enzyme
MSPPDGHKLSRRRLFQAGGAGALAMTAASCAGEDFEPESTHADDAPNVLLLVTDSTRADFLTTYNPRSIAKTPNLDALANDSLTFDWAVPESMPTGPVRRAMLSGMRGFPYRDWVVSEGLPAEAGWTPIGDDQPIFTETLGEADVTTAYVTDNPFLVGPRFANFRRTLDYAVPQYSQGAYRFFNKPLERIAPYSQVDKYILPALSDTVEVGRLRSHVGWNNLFRRTEKDYSAPRVMRAGMRLLDDLEKQQPFFLGLDSFDPHEPFDAPPIYVKSFAPKPKGNMERAGIELIQPWETPADPVEVLDIDDDSLERIRELYASEVMYVDKWIGRMLNRMDDRGLLDNTVVIYLSDHGLTLGEHGIIGKSRSRLYSHIYHVPYMIRHPEGKLAGERSDYFASTHDVARTILSFQGVRAPGLMNGEDLSVLFDGREPPSRPYFTACYAEYLVAGDRRYTLITETTGRERRLYDRENDPGELEDIADQNPEKVDELFTALLDDAGGTLPQIADGGVLGG